MSKNHVRRRNPSIAIALCGAAVVLSSASGYGQPARQKDRRACANAYEKAQELRQASKLRRSREALLGCAKSSCGEFVQTECKRWLTEVDSEMPSVVIAAKNESAEPVIQVDVTMDGELLTSQVDGHATNVDPGVHDFYFRTSAGAVAERRLVIAKGDRNRIVEIELKAQRPRTTEARPTGATGASVSTKPAEPVASTPAASLPLKVETESGAAIAAPGAESSTSAWPYVVGGVGVVGVAGYGLLYAMAKADNKNLLTECWPSCSEKALDRVRNTFLASDISLGVGIAALGAATFLYFQSGSSPEKSSKQSASYTVDVTPSRSGVLATVNGSF